MVDHRLWTRVSNERAYKKTGQALRSGNPPQERFAGPSFLNEIQGIQHAVQISVATALTQASDHPVGTYERRNRAYSIPDVMGENNRETLDEPVVATTLIGTIPSAAAYPFASNAIKATSNMPLQRTKMRASASTSDMEIDSSSSSDMPISSLKRKAEPDLDSDDASSRSTTILTLKRKTLSESVKAKKGSRKRLKDDKTTPKRNTELAPVLPNLQLKKSGNVPLDVTDSTPSMQTLDESDDWSDEGLESTFSSEAERVATPINAAESESDGLSPMSPTSRLYPEEKEFLYSIDDKITEAELDEMLDKREHKIDDDQVNEILHILDQRIGCAEKRVLEPGGKICWENARELVKYLRYFSGESLWDFAYLNEHEEWDKPRVPRNKKQGMSCMVEDEIFFAPTEFVAVKVLPKFIGMTDEPVFTADILMKGVVQKVKELLQGDLVILLRDHESDFYSVRLEARGDERLVNASLNFIRHIVYTRQLRYLPSVDRISALCASDQQSIVHKLAKGAIHGSRTSQTSDRISGYLNFSNKVKDMKIKEIEFSAVPLTKIKSSMWERHKTEFGLHCDDNCPCAFELESMTCNVVGDYLKQQTVKNSKRRNFHGLIEGEYPIGFINNFIPKFLGLLRNEFPSESPMQVYRRLEAMWTKHRGSVRYGMSCKKNCHCGEAWEVVFKRGHFEEHSSIPSLSGLANVSQGSTRSIPRSKATLLEGAQKKLSTANQDPAPNQHKEFEIDFASSKALGFFCVTDASRPVCKISSVNAYLNIDPRLAVGTIVVAAAVSGMRLEWNRILSHKDIERLYERAKTKEKRISVRFINSDVKAVITGPQSWNKGANKDWNPTSGAWQGRASDGWAGGAASGNSAMSKSIGMAESGTVIPPLTVRNILAPTARNGADQENNTIQQQPPNTTFFIHEAPLDKPSFEFFSKAAATNHRGRSHQPKTILRPPKKTWCVQEEAEKKTVSLHNYLPSNPLQRKNPKIKFRDQFEKRFYSRHDFSFEMAVPLNKETEDIVRASFPTMASVQKKEREQSLCSAAFIEAVSSSSKTYTDLFVLLKEGASPTSMGTSARTPEDCIKDKLVSLKGEANRYENGHTTRIILEKQLSDATRKMKLLKIFTIGQYVMNQARFLKSHEKLYMQLVSSKNLFLTDLGTELQADDCVWWDVVLKGCKVPRTPSARLAIDIDWAHVKDYHCNENLELTKSRGAEESTLLLKLKKGTQDGACFDLGTTMITLREIRHAAMSTDGVMERDLEPSKYLKRCKVVLKVQRDIVNKEYREKKRNEALKKLKDLLQQIDTFATDTGDSNMESIAAEMRLSMPNAAPISLLHAAVYLDEPDVVDKLVHKYGADPHSKKSRETPLALAEKKFDKVSGELELELRKKRYIIHSLLLGKTREESESDFIAFNSGAGPEDDDDDGDDADRIDGESLPDSGSTTTSKSYPSRTDTQDVVADESHAWPSPEGFSSNFEIQSEDFRDQRSLRVPELSKYDRRSSSEHGEYDALRKGKKGDSTFQLQDCNPTSTLRLNRDWMDPSTRGPCRYFNNPASCLRGPLCLHSHITPPLGLIVNRIDTSSFHLQNNRNAQIHIKEVNSNGTKYYTAGLIDDLNIRYYGEGGDEALFVEDLGVSWYYTREEAENAVKHVARIYHNSLHLKSSYIHQRPRILPPSTKEPPKRTSARGNERSIDREHSIKHSSNDDSPERSLPQLYSNLFEPTRRGGAYESSLAYPPGQADDESTNIERDSVVFRKLLKAPNFSTTYARLYKKPLRRDDWTVRKLNDYFSAEFSAEVDGIIERYESGQHPGGIHLEGRWWYRSEQKAKASAFDLFLDHAAHRGMVNADKLSRIDGLVFDFA